MSKVKLFDIMHKVRTALAARSEQVGVSATPAPSLLRSIQSDSIELMSEQHAKEGWYPAEVCSIL